MNRSLLDTDWWFTRLYPGGLDHLDVATSMVLPPLVEMAVANGAARWFFIQYTDVRGPHLRVRVRGPRDLLDRLHRRLPSLKTELQEVARHPVAGRGSLTPLELRPFSGRHVGADVALYEPEYDKYGGPTGIELAEEVFQHSSRLALWGSGLPRHPDRAALALLLLSASVSALQDHPQGVSAGQFWHRHLAWWTHDVGRRAEELRGELRAIAAEDSQGVADSATSLARDPAVRMHLRDWKTTLSQYLDRAGKRQVSYSAGHLVFHQSHMMCNRLGILPREEALLGIMASQLERIGLNNVLLAQ